ncbi:MAG: TetR/AcrR family transcriptional regulator [Myxococcota bacterium]|nr:TetR/AcrR family transcriptional regulator [Myxococcota bacterium]
MSQPYPPTLPTGTEVPVGRRARQRADTRERLFEAALAEFRSVGVAAGQIDRIARAAGVVRGTFYFHFPTKDDVLIELKDRMEHQMLIRMAELRLQRPPLFDVLARVADSLQEIVSAVGSTELVREMLSLYVRRPEPPSEDGPSVAEELGRHIAAAQERGELRLDLSVDQIALLFLTSTFGFLAGLEGDELQTALHSLAGVVARGIRPTD